MLFNKELNDNKLILVNLKLIKSFIITSQLNLAKLISFAKTKLFKIIKTLIYCNIKAKTRRL